MLALILTPKLGVEGPAVATAGAFAVVLPVLLRTGLRASGASLERARRGAPWLPAYVLGAVLAGALAAIRFGLEPETLAPVAGVAILGVLGLWAAYYALVLDPGERELVRGLLRR